MFQYEPMLRDATRDFSGPASHFSRRTTAPAKRFAAEGLNDHSTAVIISTRGRPAIVNALVSQLAEQSKPPEHVFVIGSKPDDITGLNSNQDKLTVRVGRVGSSLQRNDGIALAGSRFSYIVFFDDDFVPSRFWLERMQDVFRSRPDVVGLTGAVLVQFCVTCKSQVFVVAPVQVRFATLPDTLTMIDELPGLFVQDAASKA